ncbi:MAG: hypothetical protein HY021_12335 [Burkholderiales bacterium]|nr:hypothetical protein [Burkholderiales bacterium]
MREQWSGAGLSFATPLVRWLTADLGLDRAERRDTLQRLLRDGAGHSNLVLVHVPERSSRVRPASRFLDTSGRTNLPVAATGVGLQDAAVVPEVVLLGSTVLCDKVSYF